MNSALKYSSNFLLCVGYFSRKKTSCLFFFPHLSNLAVRNEFTELLLAHAQDIVGIIAILFFLVDVFDRK